METDVYWQTQVRKDLQVMNNNVLLFKDAAKVKTKNLMNNWTI